jgi:hypothetical protein
MLASRGLNMFRNMLVIGTQLRRREAMHLDARTIGAR